MKKRKPRTKSLDMCNGCYYVNCDSLHGMCRTPYIKKRDYRLANNLCVGCGKNPCKCKTKQGSSLRFTK
jgi:hypothetical protein